MRKCTLDPEIHNCEYLVRETLECKNDFKCSFRKDDDVPEPARKEKWYWKYYK